MSGRSFRVLCQTLESLKPEKMNIWEEDVNYLNSSKKTRMSIQTMKQNSFQTSGPKLFNSLPKEIRNIKKFTEDEFKEKLDEYLQKLPDQPKIDGLIPRGQDLEGKPSNSILFQVARGPSKSRGWYTFTKV